MVNSEVSKWALFQNHGIIMQLLLFTCNGTPEQSCVIRFGSRILTNCWSFSVGILSFFSLWKTGFDLGCSLFLTNSYCYGWTVLQLVAGWDTNMPKNVGNWKMLNSDVAPLSMSPWQTDCSWPHVCSLQCMNTNKVCVTREAYLSGVTFHFSWTQAI